MTEKKDVFVTEGSPTVEIQPLASDVFKKGAPNVPIQPVSSDISPQSDTQNSEQGSSGGGASSDQSSGD